MQKIRVVLIHGETVDVTADEFAWIPATYVQRVILLDAKGEPYKPLELAR